MASVLLLFLAASCCTCLCIAEGDTSLEFETRALEFPHKSQEEKDLIEALQEVLEKLKNKQMPLSEKKLGWLPSCDAGEQCAVRKGARVGTLCGCPRGTTCNFYVLKCL